VPPDRQAPEQLAGLAVRGDEQPLSFPPIGPCGFREPGHVEVVPGPRELAPARADRHMTLFEATVDVREPSLEDR
jgi:hypothetical protein